MFGIPLKPILYVTAVLAVLGFARWAYGAIYDAGYDQARLELQQKAIENQNEAIALAREQWEAEQEAAGIQIVVEEKIVERIKVVREEIPTVVERIVEVTPECRNLGPDFVGLWNDAIIASRSGALGSPDAQPGADAALPADGAP